MATKQLILARTTPDGKITGMTLAEWAARFNAEHRLAPPKEQSRK